MKPLNTKCGVLRNPKALIVVRQLATSISKNVTDIYQPREIIYEGKVR